MNGQDRLSSAKVEACADLPDEVDGITFLSVWLARRCNLRLMRCPPLLITAATEDWRFVWKTVKEDTKFGEVSSDLYSDYAFANERVGDGVQPD